MQTVDQFLQSLSSSSASNSSMQSVDDFLTHKDDILPSASEVTQHFGNYNPSLEVFSGGVARDTNFTADPNTPVKAPKGSWKVVKSYSQANPQGQPGDGTNDGYGNAVMLQNIQTGDRLHMIHLSSTGVKPGDVVAGGDIIGLTGSSGNATGPNLGVEYYDPQGQLNDVLQSPYAKYFPVAGQEQGPQGGGGLGDEAFKQADQATDPAQKTALQIAGALGNGIGYIGNGIGYGLNAIQQGAEELFHPQATQKVAPLPIKPQAIVQKPANDIAANIGSAFVHSRQTVKAQTLPQPAAYQPNITIPDSQTGQPRRLDPKIAQILLNSFNATGEATNAAQVLSHTRSQTYTPSEIKQIGHPSFNYGENASFNPTAGDSPNGNGTIDRGLMRINSDTFKGWMSNPNSKAKLEALGITTYDDMKDPQKNADFANLLQQEGGWQRWYAAPLSLREKD